GHIPLAFNLVGQSTDRILDSGPPLLDNCDLPGSTDAVLDQDIGCPSHSPCNPPCRYRQQIGYQGGLDDDDGLIRSGRSWVLSTAELMAKPSPDTDHKYDGARHHQATNDTSPSHGPHASSVAERMAKLPGTPARTLRLAKTRLAAPVSLSRWLGDVR